jgi:hypothetical protein
MRVSLRGHGLRRAMLEKVGLGFLYERIERLETLLKELNCIQQAHLNHIGQLEAQIVVWERRLVDLNKLGATLLNHVLALEQQSEDVAELRACSRQMR